MGPEQDVSKKKIIRGGINKKVTPAKKTTKKSSNIVRTAVKKTMKINQDQDLYCDEGSKPKVATRNAPSLNNSINTSVGQWIEELVEKKPLMNTRDNTRKRAAKENSNTSSPVKRAKEICKTDTKPKKETDKKEKYAESKPGTSFECDSYKKTEEKTKVVKTKCDSNIVKIIARDTNISNEICLNIIKSLENDHTIPFLVRYRSQEIGFKTADELRLIKHKYNNLKKIEQRALSIKKILKSTNQFTAKLESHIDSCQTLDELESLYGPYKKSKMSRIQKATELGIVQKVIDFLSGKSPLTVMNLIDPELELVKDHDTVLSLIVHIIGDRILKDVDLISQLDDLYKFMNIYILSVQKNKKPKDERQNQKKDNFANYYKFRKHYKAIKAHHVLAINRGEELKELKVSVELPYNFNKTLEHFLSSKWNNRGLCRSHYDFIYLSITGEVVQKLTSKICKKIRSDLTISAEKEALEVFASNLKWLLLTRPVCNQTVMAIDPGYKNGCKIAVVSHELNILATTIANLCQKDCFTRLIHSLIRDHMVSLVAIGNGIGCRDVEQILGQIIKRYTDLNVKYSIVGEQGLSIYSVTSLAKDEYPDLTPNLISAVSLAKRVIDPLGELLKVEPKHLGVGMYQHDMHRRLLSDTQSEVISEVVSSVGINLNTAPLTLLKQVAGLSEKKAKAIIEYRNDKGMFQTRKDLLKVGGIGPKCFQQCAGFVRIFIPKDERTDLVEPLDQTIIHPEEYTVASRFIAEVCNLDKHNIGDEKFIGEVKRVTKLVGKTSLSKELKINESTFELIFEGLTKQLHYDLRMDYAEQLFRKEITSVKDLKLGQVITGRIENVTPFGSFIDIGVERAMLMLTTTVPKSLKDNLHLGQKVKVRVDEIDKSGLKVSLGLVSILSV